MKEARELTTGVVTTDNALTSVVHEILDHQGIIYENISPNEQDSSTIFPVVILPEYTEQGFSAAKKICVSEENVLIADKIVNLRKIRQFLAGEISVKGDQFDLYINTEETNLVSQVKDRLARLNLPLVRKSFWPNKARACCVITHDIDWFTYSPFHKAVLGGDLNPLQAVKLFVTNLFRRRNYGWNIPEMVDLEVNHDCKSTFLFRTEYPERELTYLDQSLQLLKEKIERKQGFEIALHGAHSSHHDLKALETELSLFREKVGQETVGIRYHILKFIPPQTWKIESEKNILYDATFSYNEYFGFRGEVCFPYHPCSDVGRLPLIELPTSFMDWTLLHRKKRGRSAESTLQRVKESVERYNGVLTVNFHNTYINQQTFPDIYELYASLLSQVAAEKYWVATASECARWWNERTSAKPNPRITSSGEITAFRTLVELDVIDTKEFSVKYN